jgi:hypothetical protein
VVSDIIIHPGGGLNLGLQAEVFLTQALPSPPPPSKRVRLTHLGKDPLYLCVEGILPWEGSWNWGESHPRAAPAGLYATRRQDSLWSCDISVFWLDKDSILPHSCSHPDSSNFNWILFPSNRRLFEDTKPYLWMSSNILFAESISLNFVCYTRYISPFWSLEPFSPLPTIS